MGAYVFGYNSPAAASREVFKHSTDSAFSFGFGVLLGGVISGGVFVFLWSNITRPWTTIEWAHILAQVFSRN